MSQFFQNVMSVPSVPITFQSQTGGVNDGTAQAAGNIINFNGTNGIEIIASGNTVTISEGNSQNWSDVSGSLTLLPNVNVFVNATCSATLPATGTAVQGSFVNFIVDSASELTILPNTGQKIRIAAAVCTVTTGNMMSTNQGCSVSLYFRNSDQTWLALNALGSWTPT